MSKKNSKFLGNSLLGIGLALAFSAAPLVATAQTYNNTATADYATTPPTPVSGFLARDINVDAASNLTALGSGRNGFIYNLGLGLLNNLNQSGGSILATGDNLGDGIHLLSGAFNQSGGSIQATGDNFGVGIYLSSGAFNQSGGSIQATGVNLSEGIRLLSGDFNQSGGSILATGDNSGSGIFLDSGDFNQSGGSIQATGDNSGAGILLLSGDFNQSGGSIQATGDNGGAGIVLNSGDFNQSGGSIQATGDSGVGIYLGSGAFNQSGGSIQATGVNGVGIDLISGAFNQSGGSILATGDSGFGINLFSGAFNQSGGSILATGDNSGNGIFLDSGNFNQSGGSIQATGVNGSGINLLSGDFNQSGGSIQATGDNFGLGIRLFSGDFNQSGGSILATGVNNSNGILLLSGDFNQSGGSLTLMPGDGTGTAVTGNGNANFTGNAILRPGIDLAANRTGTMFVLGSANIAPGVKLQPLLINSLALDKGSSSLPLTFLQASSTGTGTFTAPANTLTMNYLYTSSSNAHNLTISRKAYVSDILQGSNSNVSRAIENNRNWLQTNPLATPILGAYSTLDMSESQDELNEKTRSLTAWGATLLGAQAINNFDTAQGSVFNNLNSLSRRTTSPNLRAAANSAQTTAPAAGEMSGDSNTLSNSNTWAMWLTPLGRHDSIDAKSASSADMDGNTFGVNTGLARHFNGGTLALSGFFLTGELSGGNTELDSNTFGLLGAFRTNPLGSGTFAPWLEFGAGYAYTNYDQERIDILGFENSSDPTQHAARLALALGQDIYCSSNALRLTPIIGLDYTYAWQSDYSESSIAPTGGGLALDVNDQDMNSLRGKIGGEVEYTISDAFAVDAHAFYRYEFLDTHVDLDSQFAQTPIAFETEGEDYDRSSGNIGIGATYNISNDVSLRGGYDFTLGDEYQGHEVDLSLIWEF